MKSYNLEIEYRVEAHNILANQKEYREPTWF